MRASVMYMAGGGAGGRVDKGETVHQEGQVDVC